MNGLRIFLCILLMTVLSTTAFAYTLSGEISGAEWFGGITYVYALSLDVANPSFYIGLALLGNGIYFIFNVPEGTYILLAFQDRDGNLVPSIDDYMGYYGGAIPMPIEVAGNVSDLDIAVEPLPYTTIAGALSCPEGSFGLSFILAATDPQFEDVAGWSIPLTLDGNAEYTLFVDPGEYYVLVYLDADFSFSRTADDPQVFYGAPDYPVLVDVTGSSAQNIDLPMIIPPEVNLTLTPQGTPIVIPPGGGSFDYTISVQNTGSETANVHLWLDATLPDGSSVGPLLGPIASDLPPGFSGDRDRTQAVPGFAPAGEYSFNGCLGVYPAIVWSEASFAFEKSGVIENAGAEWISEGDDFGEWPLSAPSDNSADEFVNQPSRYALCQAFPNPFNPTTTIGFTLPEAMKINLAIYDISGRLVATLVNGWRDAGAHKVTYDASNLASGMYIYTFRAGNFISSSKMVLVK